jgi:Flp pilus assembly protein protease CpaA
MSPSSLNILVTPLRGTPIHLVLPLVLSLWMAWSDLKGRRIPNYLTLGCLLAGLGYQLGSNGLTGLIDGLLGMALGFGLLIFCYVKGGMGAGDVKALVALGAWLGLWPTLHLFIYMACAGLLLIVVVLWQRGLLWDRLRQVPDYLLNLILLRPHGRETRAVAPDSRQPSKSEQIPYAVALAIGMAIICWRGFSS